MIESCQEILYRNLLLYLINIYTTFLKIFSNSSIRLFADDTSLNIMVDDPIQAADQPNSDLEKFHGEADKWLVTFNPENAEYILFSSK